MRSASCQNDSVAAAAVAAALSPCGSGVCVNGDRTSLCVGPSTAVAGSGLCCDGWSPAFGSGSPTSLLYWIGVSPTSVGGYCNDPSRSSVPQDSMVVPALSFLVADSAHW